MNLFFCTSKQLRTLIRQVCISARIAAGWENPRKNYEAPSYRLTPDFRQRQLHDEDKSCGIQPAYIRVIYRRLLLLS
jgi:hypothetical protein